MGMGMEGLGRRVVDRGYLREVLVQVGRQRFSRILWRLTDDIIVLCIIVSQLTID